MSVKVIIEIQGNLYDFWDCRALERDVRYNEDKGELEYLIVMNRQSIAANFTAVEFAYPTEEIREADFARIREQISFFEGALMLEAGTPLSALKAQIVAAAERIKEEEKDEPEEEEEF